MSRCRWEDPETSDPCLSAATWRVQKEASCAEHIAPIALRLRSLYGLRTLSIEPLAQPAEDWDGPPVHVEAGDPEREADAWRELGVLTPQRNGKRARR